MTLRLAVAGFMFEIGTANKWLDSFFRDLPPNATSASRVVDLNGVYPVVGNSPGKFVQYTGSLTTPPCREGVEFHIFTAPQTISQEQLDRYPFLLSPPSHPTNRAIQPLNGRVIYTNDCPLNCNEQRQHCHARK